MTTTTSGFLRNEFGGVPFKAVVLMASVFGASAFGIGRFVEEARAQSTLQTEISLTLPLGDLRMSAQARAEVEAALRSLTDADLAMTYARIHATFRDYIGRDDLAVARALCDYAMLAEVELQARNLTRPVGTESARTMLTTYELVL